MFCCSLSCHSPHVSFPRCLVGFLAERFPVHSQPELPSIHPVLQSANSAVSQCEAQALSPLTQSGRLGESVHIDAVQQLCTGDAITDLQFLLPIITSTSLHRDRSRAGYCLFRFYRVLLPNIDLCVSPPTSASAARHLVRREKVRNGGCHLVRVQSVHRCVEKKKSERYRK